MSWLKNGDYYYYLLLLLLSVTIIIIYYHFVVDLIGRPVCFYGDFHYFEKEVASGDRWNQFKWALVSFQPIALDHTTGLSHDPPVLKTNTAM